MVCREQFEHLRQGSFHSRGHVVVAAHPIRTYVCVLVGAFGCFGCAPNQNTLVFCLGHSGVLAVEFGLHMAGGCGDTLCVGNNLSI